MLSWVYRALDDLAQAEPDCRDERNQGRPHGYPHMSRRRERKSDSKIANGGWTRSSTVNQGREDS